MIMIGALNPCGRGFGKDSQQRCRRQSVVTAQSVTEPPLLDGDDETDLAGATEHARNGVDLQVNHQVSGGIESVNSCSSLACAGAVLAAD